MTWVISATRSSAFARSNAAAILGAAIGIRLAATKATRNENDRRDGYAEVLRCRTIDA
jgi:hypothetical protein